MADTINLSMDEIRSGVGKLQSTANAFVNESSYDHNPMSGTLQANNGVDAVSTGRAMTKLSYIDNITFKSLGYWKDTVDNLATFVSDSAIIMEQADGQ